MKGGDDMTMQEICSDYHALEILDRNAGGEDLTAADRLHLKAVINGLRAQVMRLDLIRDVLSKLDKEFDDEAFYGGPSATNWKRVATEAYQGLKVAFAENPAASRS